MMHIRVYNPSFPTYDVGMYWNGFNKTSGKIVDYPSTEVDIDGERFVHESRVVTETACACNTCQPVPELTVNDFQVGDVVEVVELEAGFIGHPRVGLRGSVIGWLDDKSAFAVRFDESFEMSHSCNGKCEHDRGRWYGGDNCSCNLHCIRKVTF